VHAAIPLSLGLAAIRLAVSETPVWHWISAMTLGSILLRLLPLSVWVRTKTRAATCGST
jgi:hypothetical protein